MKILYYYSKLNIGGAERSTVRLLNKFVEAGYDVTLLLRWNGGNLEQELDTRVKILYLKYMSEKESFIANCVQSLLAIFRQLRLKKVKYDLVISGLFGYDPKILFKHIRAKKYFQMLRNDVEKTGAYGKTKEYMRKYGELFDAYIGVSEYVTHSFIKCYPNLANKAHTIYNIIPEFSPRVKRPCPEPLLGEENTFKILTLCRMADEAKGLFRMERICKRLCQKYKDFKWFVVGEGKDKEKLSEHIKNDGIDDVMILCPATQMPQDYYYNVDLVAVLSYYEGLCGVVNEAKMMEKPVIATDFSGIREQINNGVNGYIADNDEEKIYCLMDDLLGNREKIRNTAINGMNQDLLNNELKVHKYEQLSKMD